MIIINAQIRFFQSAIRMISFPIVHNIRLSIWAKGTYKSLPSEFLIEKPIQIDGNKHKITVRLNEWNGTETNFKIGTEFNIGSLNSPLGEGIVLDIHH